MHAMAARRIGRGMAALGCLGLLGATAPVHPAMSPATEVLARVAHRDAGLESYAVPVHMDVRIHKLITFHVRLSGTQYFKRPDRIALDIRAIPTQYRKLFADLGTPLTWANRYDFRLVGAGDEGDPLRLQGVPMHACGVARLDVDAERGSNTPLHAQWTMRDGGTIDMRIAETWTGGFELPHHTDAQMSFGGYRIDASIDYGDYAVNAAVADSVFDGF